MSALQRLLETPRFQYFIITVIVINAITLGLETDPEFLARHEGLLHALDRIALAIFTVEIALKLMVYRLRFFKDAWNVFDFTIVAVALVPASGAFSVLRAMRILRALRLVSMVKSMRRVVAALLSALPDDGTGQTAVVASGNAEIHPHLNRGNTKIVYASNSGGDYEIYTANFNGSGQTALTSNTISDGNPSWSPDGSKIVFEAYRNGEADIYVMNADGTNQVRLTTHPDFDGMPSWSPDGSKIAFVSRRTGGYRIYVMNPDGSGQTQLSSQPYSLRPHWSPDGTQIAYDADGDGDGMPCSVRAA